MSTESSRMSSRLIAAAGLAAVLLSGCGAGGTAEQEVATSPAAGDPSGGGDWSGPADRVCPEGGGDALIDWVDFVKLDGRVYSLTGSPEATADPELVRRPVGKVRCRLSDMVSDPDYRIQNGDAAFLPLGTRVYRFGKSDPRLRVLVKRENGYRVYEAEHVRGTTGSEVLDLRVGITAVHLVDEHTGKKILRSITDDGNVARIRSALASAPVLRDPPEPGGDDVRRYFIRLDLRDGTSIQRSWWPEQRLLWPALKSPAVLEDLLLP